MSAVIRLERIAPAPMLGVWVYSREWLGRDDMVRVELTVGEMRYLHTEADACHEVERLGLRNKADRAALADWTPSEGVQ